MNERTTRILVLVLLVALNAGLLGYYVSEQVQQASVAQSNMANVVALYREKGISFLEEPSAGKETYTTLNLQTADLTRMAENYLGDEPYTMSYIYGSSVQYRTGNVVLLTNRSEHIILYSDSSVGSWPGEASGLTQDNVLSLLQPVARKYAQAWLGEVVLSHWEEAADGIHFQYYQVTDGRIYFFNSVSCVVTLDGIKSGTISYWEVSGKGQRLTTLPTDEILYAGLLKITENGLAPGTVTSVSDGYVISRTQQETATAVPVQTLWLSSGDMISTRYSGNP